MTLSVAMIDEQVYPPHKVALLVGVLREEGVAPADALAGSGIDASVLLLPATRISYRQLLTVMGNVQKHSRNPAVALDAGRRIRVTSYGLYGYALVSCQSAREAIELAMRYQKLAMPMMHWRAREEDVPAWIFEDIFGLEPDDDLYRFILEFQLGNSVSLNQDVMGPECKPREVLVKFPAPAYAESYRAHLDCPIQFGQPENESRYDAAWLDRRPNLANPITAAMLRETCDRLLSEMKLTSDIASKVHRVLLQNPGRFPDEEQVAEQLFMVARTLRRKLEAEGTSYHQILSDVRKHLAIKYLRETRMNTDDIAGSLGFSDAASFRHAFKRWTNKTPSDFRPN